VVCVFAIANNPSSRPYITHGASASERNPDEAISKAFHEMEVGLAVMQGKRKRKIDPQEVDTPEDHGRLYYYPEHAGELAYLFSGEYVENILPVKEVDLDHEFNPIFVALTEQESLLHVVRAISDKLIPINFGYGRDHVSHHTLKEVIKPVPFPHYLA